MKKTSVFLLVLLLSPLVWGQSETASSFEVKPVGNYFNSMTRENGAWVVNLGNIEPDERFDDINFWVINHADSALLIERVFWGEPNCGPEWDRDPVPPGDSTLVSYFCGGFRHSSGRIQKTSLIRTNQGMERIIFKGTILPKRQPGD